MRGIKKKAPAAVTGLNRRTYGKSHIGRNRASKAKELTHDQTDFSSGQAKAGIVMEPVSPKPLSKDQRTFSWSQKGQSWFRKTFLPSKDLEAVSERYAHLKQSEPTPPSEQEIITRLAQTQEK